MQNQENHHQRKPIRLKEFDYTQPGAYFVTVVSHRRKNIFGEIIDGEMNLDQAGKIVEKTWQNIPMHFPNTSCEIFVVMPNHIHGIIDINNDQIVEARHASPLRSKNLKSQSVKSDGVKPQSLGAIIGSFKSAVTKQLHQTKIINQEKIWQRNYYEHIIRDEQDYQQIVEYILSNPFNWEFDHENPENIEPFSKISLK
jgi:REP element-mobilizing transposase RayT